MDKGTTIFFSSLSMGVVVVLVVVGSGPEDACSSCGTKQIEIIGHEGLISLTKIVQKSLNGTGNHTLINHWMWIVGVNPILVTNEVTSGKKLCLCMKAGNSRPPLPSIDWFLVTCLWDPRAGIFLTIDQLYHRVYSAYQSSVTYSVSGCL